MSSDEAVAQWIEQSRKEEPRAFLDPLVLDIQDVQNPFITVPVRKFMEDRQSGENPMLKVYTDRAKKVSASEESISPQPYTSSRKIVFKNQAKKMASVEPSSDISGHPEETFFLGSDIDRSFAPIMQTSDFRVKESQFLLTTLEKFQVTVGAEFIEPFIGSAFLFREGKILSESWNFCPDKTIPFFERTERVAKRNEKVGFSVCGNNQNVYLVMILKRLWMPDHGSICNKYYGNQSKSNTKKARETVATAWETSRCVFTPFAWTFISLNNLISSGTAQLPDPMQISGMPAMEKLSGMISAYEEAPHKHKGLSWIKMEVSMSEKNARDPLEVAEKENFSFCHNLHNLAVEPNVSFRNQIVFELQNAKFKFPSGVKASEVFARISLRDGVNGNANRVFIGQTGVPGGKYITTISDKNGKTPRFECIATVDMPRTVSKDLCFVVEYFDISMKKKVVTERVFGMSYLPLFTDDGIMIRSGNHMLNVNYHKSKSVSELSEKQSTNITWVNVFFKSSLYFSCPELSAVFKDKKMNLDSLAQVPPASLVYDLLAVLETLMNRMIESPDDVFEALKIITHMCMPIYDGYIEFLTSYVTELALRDTEHASPEFHRQLLSGWGGICETFAGKPGIERIDIHLCDILFMLVIKSLQITKDRELETSFRKFIVQWTLSISPLVESGFLQAKSFTKSFAQFLTGLFDLGYASLTCEAIQVQVDALGETGNDHNLLMYFLEHVLHPKLFIASILHVPEFSREINELVSYAKKTKNSIHLQAIFRILLNIFSYYTDKEASQITPFLLPCVGSMLPLAEFPFIGGHEICASLQFFIYVLLNVPMESFKQWWTVVNHDDFFNALHCILDLVKVSHLKSGKDSTNDVAAMENLSTLEGMFSGRTTATLTSSGMERPASSRTFAEVKKAMGSMKEKKRKSLASIDTDVRISEAVYSAEFGVLNALKLLCEIDGEANLGKIVLAMYHLISTDFAVDVAAPCCDLVCEMLKKWTKQMFMTCKPALTKFMMKIIEIALVNEEACAKVLNTLYDVDAACYGTTNRSDAICTRAIYLLGKQELNSLPHPRLAAIQERLGYINDILELPTEDIDSKGGLIYEKSVLLSASPDSRYEVLTQLAQYHRSNEYYAEEIQVMLLQAALVLEYLTILKKLPSDLWRREHPALVFLPVLSCAELAICPEEILKDLPHVPTFCDSDPFSGYALVNHLVNIIERCRETRHFETSSILVDILWPLLERFRAFNGLKEVMTETSAIYQNLSQIPAEDDRLFGRYFRISFYGSIFGDENGKIYIYREKKLAHLWEVCDRIVNLHKKELGDNNIELIKEKTVNPETLDPAKGYIQITYVEPFIAKKDASKRVTLFEKSHNLQVFSYDAPFVQGANKAQGSVDQQWLRRCKMSLKYPMPFVLKRQELSPDGIETEELEPIRVSYRQLRERVNMMKGAVDRRDTRQVQQLLHGSLLAQVNDGPTKFAEAFLSDGADTKYTRKLKQAFNDFVTVNEEGLKLHAGFVNENPTFAMLQHELESAFVALKDIIQTYTQK